MSTTMRESSHVSRKYVSHGGGNGGGAISGQGHSGNTSSNSLENNLDALLEDLQTSVSRSGTPSRGGRAKSPQVEYRSAANTSKTIAEVRSLSPARSKTTKTEKFVSTGPAGIGSGIPGLELLDAELRNVQPGQSKTVAYKQVSYAYNKNSDGKPIGVTDSYTLSDNSLTSGAPLIDDIHETSYEEGRLHRRHRSPEPVIKSSTTVNRELLFDDSYTTPRSKQTSPLPGTQSRDLKFTRESNFQTDVRPVQTINTSQEFGNVEYVPVPSPTPAVPINLAPGPNTKVTTTIKTYTYELPGAPDTYLPGTTGGSSSSNTTLQKNVHLAGDQRITYTLPRGGSLERPISPTRYGNSPTPPEVTQKSKILHKEAKYYQEEIHGYPPGKPSGTIYTSGPPGPNLESTITRNEYYRQTDGNYPNGYGPDRPDHTGGSNTTIIYQNQHQPPPTINETHTTTTIDRFEEHFPNRPSSGGRPDYHKPGTPTRSTTVNYYTASPPQNTPPQANTTLYKYSNTTTIVPPGHHPDDHEVLLPKPFPTGIQVYPSNGKSPNNGQGPPAKLEDLMASFSDSEREVLDDIAKQENYQRKDRVKDTVSPKKEVDFVPHTPAQLQSKNVAGPPVYYPPGSAEFTKKESAEGGMSQSGGAWAKGRGNYEYAASEKSRSKSSSGKAVIPVCLPLCCGLPCVIL